MLFDKSYTLFCDFVFLERISINWVTLDSNYCLRFMGLWLYFVQLWALIVCFYLAIWLYQIKVECKIVWWSMHTQNSKLSNKKFLFYTLWYGNIISRHLGCWNNYDRMLLCKGIKWYYIQYLFKIYPVLYHKIALGLCVTWFISLGRQLCEKITRIVIQQLNYIVGRLHIKRRSWFI